VDVGAGSVGTFEKDEIARIHGFTSGISKQFAEALLQYHHEQVGSLPEQVVIALPDDYFVGGKLSCSKDDLKGLSQTIAKELGRDAVRIVPYSGFQAKGQAPSATDLEGRVHAINHNDLVLVYNPNKPMRDDLEKTLERHARVFGSRHFAAITDKRRNGPFLLAGVREDESAAIIVPRKGPTLAINGMGSIPALVREVAETFPRHGAVIKLPTPIEMMGKALPSAVFFNSKSPLQVDAATREIRRYHSAGARELVSEQLVPPHAITPGEGGVELRLYYRGRK